MENTHTKAYYKPKQGRFPMFISESLSISDPVLAFDRIMEEIEIKQYLKKSCNSHTGRPRYNPVNMLKTVPQNIDPTNYVP